MITEGVHATLLLTGNALCECVHLLHFYVLCNIDACAFCLPEAKGEQPSFSTIGCG